MFLCLNVCFNVLMLCIYYYYYFFCLFACFIAPQLYATETTKYSAHTQKVAPPHALPHLHPCTQYTCCTHRPPPTHTSICLFAAVVCHVTVAVVSVVVSIAAYLLECCLFACIFVCLFACTSCSLVGFFSFWANARTHIRTNAHTH